MKKRTRKHRKVRGSMIISTISVALVLITLGIVALTGIVARSATDSVRANIGFVAVVDDAADSTAVDSLRAELAAAPYVRAVEYRTADDVLALWQGQIGSDELPEVNPFLPEYEVKVNSEWSSADSLQAIKARLERLSAVYEEVRVHADIASDVNSTVSAVMMVLLIAAGVMLVISLVLINNTVRMEIYAQRMVIHTMQYVGATRGFIRRPYIIRSILSGLIAALIASALLAAMLWGIGSQYPALPGIVGWQGALAVMGGLALTGMAVCALASLLATTKYLRKNYDEIFD